MIFFFEWRDTENQQYLLIQKYFDWEMQGFGGGIGRNETKRLYMYKKFTMASDYDEIHLVISFVYQGNSTMTVLENYNI